MSIISRWQYSSLTYALSTARNFLHQMLRSIQFGFNQLATHNILLCAIESSFCYFVSNVFKVIHISHVGTAGAHMATNSHQPCQDLTFIYISIIFIYYIFTAIDKVALFTGASKQPGLWSLVPRRMEQFKFPLKCLNQQRQPQWVDGEPVTPSPPDIFIKTARCIEKSRKHKVSFALFVSFGGVFSGILENKICPDGQ